MSEQRETVAVLGCGILGTIIAQGLPTYRVLATHRLPERAADISRNLGIECSSDNRRACEEASIVIFAVRPQSMADLLEEVAPALRPKTLCISIAAGLPLSFYEQLLPSHVAVIRSHPSPMMAVRRGYIALSAGKRASADDVAKARRLFAYLCEDTLMMPEADINLFAALFGSSSALLYLFVEALLSVEEAGGDHGFSPRQVIAGMLNGAGQMLMEFDKSPRALCDEICTPNGMTIAGVRAWEQQDVGRLVTSAMEAVLLRVKEMARANR